ncbi:hypothetical protein NDU88_003193 [Pleurodeles waltl]|uniref:Myb-like domain-containing protein n=1 Tax=Pleurodeles waltl TaxID=8319 RepID=A0AAV7NKR7_PLEWA|nr:hypothetical protein NDU88_003193 [Pleurodeles waltl]
MCAGGRGTHRRGTHRRGQRPSEIDIWRAIAKDVRALGVHNRRGTHCRKRWEDIRRGSRKTAEALLGMASQPRRGASRTLTPLMSRILAVAYPDLDGRLRISQQAQGGGGEVASAQEGAASHMAPEGHATDSDKTSETEGEGGSTTGTRADVSDTDTSSDGSSLAVAATSVPNETTGTAATQRTSSALPAAPRPSARARTARKAAISFAPGTSGPAPVTPAALSEEVIDLLRTIIVGQSTLLNAIQGVEREVHQSNAYLEGLHSGQAAQQRSFNALASALRAAIVPVSSLPLLTPSTQSHSPGHRPAAKAQPAPPPGKRIKKLKGRRERPDTPAPKEGSLAPSPATSGKGAKGHGESAKEGKGSKAPKAGSSRPGHEGPTSPILGVSEETQGPRTPSQEGPATERSDAD